MIDHSHLKEAIFSPAKVDGHLHPFLATGKMGDPLLQKKGDLLLREGKCALLLLAGGMGSRLNFSRPKGCIPLSNVLGKTLFQIFFEKVKAASMQCKRALKVAVMTSPLNHDETLHYLQQNNFFGLSERDVHLFSQEMWPLLDQEGRPVRSEGKILYGPNGNGGAIKMLFESGVGPLWKKEGVEIVNIVPIDNPLADPFDKELFGFHHQEGNEVTIKAGEKRHPEEKVGVLIEKGGKCLIKEYNQQATSTHLLANFGLYALSLSFMERVKNEKMPIHAVKKGESWKCELFLFDLFTFSHKTAALFAEREECFAPLKNFEGEDSIASVKRALLEADRKAYLRVSGHMPSKGLEFELDQQFYYPTEALLQKWQNRVLDRAGYIEAD